MLRRLVAWAMVTALAGLASGAGPAAAQAREVKLYAAGSLRAAITELAAAFEADTGYRLAATYGASGLLRDRLSKGEGADVFASANMEHPRALAAAGLAQPVQRFTGNRLCGLAHAALGVTSETLLDAMLSPAVRLGTSTPKADPAGDYAWQVFERAEAQRPGAFATLSGKALQLVGGPNAPAPPADRSVYGFLMQQGAADLFLTYCTNAVLARGEVPGLQVIALPATLAVGADYGLVVLNGAGPGGAVLAEYLRGDKARMVLQRLGFDVEAGGASKP